METWAMAYTRFLNEFPNTGKKCFLSFDEFCENPESHLALLTSILNLKCLELTELQQGEKQHYFGGNRGVNENAKSDKSTLQVKQMPDIGLPEEHINSIRNNEIVNRVYGRLIEKYQLDFPVV